MKTIQMACRSHLFLHLSLGFITLGCVRQPPATAPEPAPVPIAVTDSTPVADESSPLAASLPEITPAPFTPPAMDLSEMTETARTHLGVPAFAISIIQGDEMVAWGASGIRAVGDDTPVSLTDKWHMGSNTKAMTAHLVAILVQEGVLSWDTTVAEVYSDLTPPNGWNEVSILDLCRHRSGIRKLNPMVSMHFYQSTESPRVQRRQWVEKVVMAHPPKDDRHYDYANANYMLAGAILEELTDQSWEKLITTQLFAPLGMAGVGFGSPGDHQPLGHVKDLAHPDGGWKSVPVGPRADNPAALGPAGTAHSDFASLVPYLAMHLDIAQQVPGPTAQPSFQTLHALPEEGVYSAGWVEQNMATDDLSEIKGRVLFHNGSNTMWTHTIGLLPEKDMAFVCATNVGVQPNYEETCWKLADQAIAAVSAAQTESTEQP